MLSGLVSLAFKEQMEEQMEEPTQPFQGYFALVFFIAVSL